MRLYFNHPSYNEHPVVGVSWEQANAFCAWRTNYLLAGLRGQAKYIQRYRLPTEAKTINTLGKTAKRPKMTVGATMRTINPARVTIPRTVT